MIPDQVKIAITVPDGGVVIKSYVVREFHPDGTVRVERDATDAGIAAELARTGYAGMPWRVVTDADLPPDRTFRNAWKDTGRLEVDLPKARDIHRERLRRDREPLLVALDTAYLRADEAGDPQEKRRIAAEKQRLRDITNDPRIDAAQTVDDLQQITVERGV